MKKNILVVQEWKKRAENVGVSLSYLCGVGGIDTSTMQRWKSKVPQAVQAVADIEAELKRLEDEKATNETIKNLQESMEGLVK